MAASRAAIDGIDVVPLDVREGALDPRVGDVLVVRGWAHLAGADDLAVVVDATTAYPVGTRLPRPDVAAALNEPGAADCGFTISIPTLELDDGEHAVAVVAPSEGERELARLRFHLSSAGSPVAGELGRGWLDSWTDETGTITPIDGARLEVPAESVVRIDGWAADVLSAEPAVAAFALVGDRVVEIAYGFERRDVGALLGEAHTYCGFSFSFPTSYVSGAGTALSVVLLGADGVALRHTEIALTLARAGDGR